jgi:hypothetical protein
MIRTKHFYVAALLVAAMAAPSEGGLLLRLDPSATLVNSGETVTVSMTLVDDGSIANVGGLFSGASRLLLKDSSTAKAEAIAGPDNMGNAGFDPNITQFFDFDLPFPVDAPSGFMNLVGISQAIGLVDPGVMPVLGEVFLAKFSIRVSGDPGTSVTLASSSLDNVPTPGDFSGIVGADLQTIFDLVDMDEATIRIAGGGGVVPEPSGLAIFAIGSLSSLCVGRRRKRQSS